MTPVTYQFHLVDEDYMRAGGLKISAGTQSSTFKFGGFLLWFIKLVFINN